MISARISISMLSMTELELSLHKKKIYFSASSSIMKSRLSGVMFCNIWGVTSRVHVLGVVLRRLVLSGGTGILSIQLVLNQVSHVSSAQGKMAPRVPNIL
jgi:hypothetical protein